MEDETMKKNYTEPIMRAIVLKNGPRLLADSHAIRSKMSNNDFMEYGGVDNDGLDPE